MSNTLIIDSLNTLFSMSNTAVLGAQEQFVAFMNPAAQELFSRRPYESQALRAAAGTHHGSHGHGIRHVRNNRKTPRHHLRNVVWCVSAVLARAAG
ncbi:MAG: hypothetical protein ACLVJ1_00775 [Oscillospiraceae bacterium]